MCTTFAQRAAKITILIFTGAVLAFLVSCREPSPLYGSWADNKGNRLSLFDDGTFNAKVTSSGRSVNYD